MGASFIIFRTRGAYILLVFKMRINNFAVLMFYQHSTIFAHKEVLVETTLAHIAILILEALFLCHLLSAVFAHYFFFGIHNDTILSPRLSEVSLIYNWQFLHTYKSFRLLQSFKFRQKKRALDMSVRKHRCISRAQLKLNLHIQSIVIYLYSVY